MERKDEDEVLYHGAQFQQKRRLYRQDSRLIDLESRKGGPRWYSPGSTPIDMWIAGTARPAS